MKSICKHCIKSCKVYPAPECDKFESFSYSKAMEERRQLIVSKDNPDRLNYLTQKLQKINGGIV